MIAHLRGTLLEKHPGQAIVETAGVGYDVTIPISTFTHLPDRGGEARLYIHTHVREDAIALFGFGTKEEKNVFEKLIGVSGIGPKLAVTILSGLETAQLVGAIRAGEIATLTRIPGVGKKTAERIALELKDKLDLIPGLAPSPAQGPPALTPLERDVLSALINLGSARPAAEAALGKAKTSGGSEDFETMFRRALELLR